MARLTDRFERLSRGETKRSFALLQTDIPVLLEVPVDSIAMNFVRSM